MAQLGTGAYPVATELDADDRVVVLVDGAVGEVPGSVLRTFAMPDGVVDVADYSTAASTQLVAADATTGFTGAGGHSGASVTLNQSIQAEGTGCVGFLMDMDTVGNPVFYYTFSSAEPIGGRTKVSFKFRYSSVGPAFTPALPLCLEAIVADSTVLTGNVNRKPLPSFPEDTWITVELPLDGLSSIKSIGVRRTVNTGVSNARADLYIDDIRKPAETKIDQARGSATEVGVIVGPSYEADANQRPLSINEAKPVLDLTRLTKKVVYLHDFYLDETGATNVAADIAEIINAAEPGQIIRATPGAYYRFDHDITVSALTGVTLDFTGSYMFLTYQSNTPFFTIDDCRDLTLLRPTMVGYGPTTHLGANMENIAGTPTDSGSGVQLNAQNEEVQLLDDTNWDLPFTFGRVLPHQVGAVDDGLGLRNHFAVYLSDTAQVADDWVVTIYDGDTSTVLAQETLTVTSSSTAYPIEYFPADITKRLRLTVKKSTATANTGTVHQVISQNRVSYSVTYDIASAILLTNSERIKIVEAWTEGFGGDGIQISDASVRDVMVIEPHSHACRRQGLSFNRGTDITIINPVVSSTGRSGIDIEPFAATWKSEDMRVYNARFYNITNYAFAMGNFARNVNIILDGADVYEARLGVISGGMRGGVMRNLRNWSVVTIPGNTDFELKCSNVTISGLVSQERIACGVNTNDYDDGSGPVTYTPGGNTLADVYLKNNLGGVKLKLAAGYDIVGPVHVESLTRSDFTGTTNAFGPIDAAGRPFANLFFGEYYRQFPNTFKAPFGSSQLWVPGGYDDFLEPRVRVGSMSGTTTSGNNYGRRAISVSNGASTHAVTFPTKTVGALTAIALSSGTASSGTLSTSTAYYYRIAPRGRVAGPGTYLAQVTRTTGGSETAIQIEVEGWMDLTNDLIVDGFTLIRGTTNGGPYTTRYDFVPNEALHGPQPNGVFFYDQGSNLVMRDFSDTDAQYGYPQTTASTAGSWTGSVNETGYEPDANYDVAFQTSWNAGYCWATNKTTAGFTANFATAAGASDTFAYEIKRYSS